MCPGGPCSGHVYVRPAAGGCVLEGRVLGTCTLGLQQGADGEGACHEHVQYICILD